MIAAARPRDAGKSEDGRARDGSEGTRAALGVVGVVAAARLAMGQWCCRERAQHCCRPPATGWSGTRRGQRVGTLALEYSSAAATGPWALRGVIAVITIISPGTGAGTGLEVWPAGWLVNPRRVAFARHTAEVCSAGGCMRGWGSGTPVAASRRCRRSRSVPAGGAGANPPPGEPLSTRRSRCAPARPSTTSTPQASPAAGV